MVTFGKADFNPRRICECWPEYSRLYQQRRRAVTRYSSSCVDFFFFETRSHSSSLSLHPPGAAIVSIHHPSLRAPFCDCSTSSVRSQPLMTAGALTEREAYRNSCRIGYKVVERDGRRRSAHMGKKSAPASSGKLMQRRLGGRENVGQGWKLQQSSPSPPPLGFPGPASCLCPPWRKASDTHLSKSENQAFLPELQPASFHSLLH